MIKVTIFVLLLAAVLLVGASVAQPIEFKTGYNTASAIESTRSFTYNTSETLNCKNWSIKFNLSEPHIISRFSIQEIEAIWVKTFNGYLNIVTDVKSVWPEPGRNLDQIGTLSKEINGERVVGNVYKSKSSSDMGYNYLCDFPDLYITSTLNLTQSMDFFKDVKISKRSLR